MDNSFSLEITSPTEEIRYTSNFTEPDESSLYNGPIIFLHWLVQQSELNLSRKLYFKIF